MNGPRWWIDVVEQPPVSGQGKVDLELLVLGLALIARQGERLQGQRFNRPTSSGAFLLGQEHRFLRGVYLLGRTAFVLELGDQHGMVTYWGVPADVDLALKAIRLYFFEPVACQALPWIKRPGLDSDPEALNAWSAAYNRLLGIPGSPAHPEPARTLEQQRNDALRRVQHQRFLLPIIDRLSQQWHERLRYLAVPDQSREPPGDASAL